MTDDAAHDRCIAVLLHNLIDVLDDEATETLCARYGGQRLYVSSRNSDKISRLLTRQKAQDLMHAFGGETIDVPLARPWRARRMRARGMDAKQIALELGVKVASVRHWLGKAEPVAQSAPLLFGD